MTLDFIEDLGRKRQGALTLVASLLTVSLCLAYSTALFESPDQYQLVSQGDPALNSMTSSLDARDLNEIKTKLELLTQTYGELATIPDKNTYAMARDEISASSSRIVECAYDWSNPSLMELNISKLNNKIETDPRNAWLYLIVRGKLHEQNTQIDSARADFKTANALISESTDPSRLKLLNYAQAASLGEFNQFWCKSEIEQADTLVTKFKISEQLMDTSRQDK